MPALQELPQGAYLSGLRSLTMECHVFFRTGHRLLPALPRLQHLLLTSTLPEGTAGPLLGMQTAGPALATLAAVPATQPLRCHSPIFLAYMGEALPPERWLPYSRGHEELLLSAWELQWQEGHA